KYPYYNNTSNGYLGETISNFSIQFVINNVTTNTSHPRYYTGTWWECQILVGTLSSTTLTVTNSYTHSGFIIPANFPSGSVGVGTFIVSPTIQISASNTFHIQARLYELGGGTNAITSMEFDPAMRTNPSWPM